MTNVQRYAASFLSDDSLLEPGDIFRKLDGTLWYVDTDGSQKSLTSGGGGGGLPTGWTQDDADPANVSTDGGDGGSLTFDDGTSSFAGLSAGAVEVRGESGQEKYAMQIGAGITSTSPADVPAFTATSDEGATVALDAGGLDVQMNGGTVFTTQVQADTEGQIKTTAAGLCIAWGDDGANPEVGFYGGDPVVQPVVPATPLPQDIVDALVALGLVSQSA